jgi:hypothetical protein
MARVADVLDFTRTLGVAQRAATLDCFLVIYIKVF